MDKGWSQSADARSAFGEVDDIVELRRIAAYFRDLADNNGSRLLHAEAAASQNRQELEQKTRGFSLLARLSSDVSATEQPWFMARILAGHLNSMLHMSRSAVLLRDPIGDRFSLLGSAGYSEAELQQYAKIGIPLPKALTQERLTFSTLGVHPDEDLLEFARFGIRYFMAVPVISDDEVKAVIITGRMRERRPFLPPLNASDIETVSAISGFFGAYLARHRLLVLDRERITDVERLVTERTAEIERQRVLLDASFQELRETQRLLIMREKLASFGQLMAGIAHEIQNPLNFINNFSDLSRELATEIEEGLTGSGAGPGSEELFVTLRSNLDKIALHGKRADSIVRNMLQHSRGKGGVPELSDLNAILGEAIYLATHAAEVEYPGLVVSVTQSFDASFGMMMLASQEISRVFLNLLNNGFYALEARRRSAGDDYAPAIRITSRRLDGVVEIRVRDNGVGIPAEVKPHIFSPFFSTKPTGEGAGLGLSLSHDIIVGGHGGSMDVESCEIDFTEFVIRLPI